jgi:uncharacterized protein (DUF2252 family)
MGTGLVTERTPDDRAAMGKAARSRARRSSHAEWSPPADRPSPVDVLGAQDTARIQELVPIRYGRMLSSPFSFYRGAAAIMAGDLAVGPRTGLDAQLCGDAHLSNFGGFAAPERAHVFDVNDFDETLPGPFEWDIKRLAASLAIAGRVRGFDEGERRSTVHAATREYREAMRRFATMRNIDVWYARLNLEKLLASRAAKASGRERKETKVALAKAEHKDSLRAFRKLTRQVDGEARIVSDPPVIVPLEELEPEAEGAEIADAIEELLAAYRETLDRERGLLMEGYRYVHLARKVVGVGSVGTHAWIVLLLGRDARDPLFLQVKEAGPSVLEPFAGKSRYEHHGRRVVEGQRLMQAASDILLGWLTNDEIGGERRDFYVRQLWDWKQSADIERMAPRDMAAYGRLCGWTLARAHARSGDRIAIGAYLGGGSAFDRAIAEFAEAYADQNERDYETVVEAAKAGRVQVEEKV